MRCETEDLVPAIESVLLPIFGGIMTLRYPSFPLYVVAQRHRVSIVSFVKFRDTKPDTLSRLLPYPQALRPLTAMTTLKTQFETSVNYHRTVRTRARKKLTLLPELHPINWCRASMEKDHETTLFHRTSRGDDVPMKQALDRAIKKTGGVLSKTFVNDIGHVPNCYDDTNIPLIRAIPKHHPFFPLSRILDLKEPEALVVAALDTYESLKETLSKKEAAPRLPQTKTYAPQQFQV